MKIILLLLFISYILMCQSCMRMRLNPAETISFFDVKKVSYISKTFSAGAHEIHYIETGSPQNPLLLFVHGSPGSWDAYKSYLADPQLLSKYHMVSVDRPGFGYSDFGVAENLQVQASLIEQLAENLSKEKPSILVGHSLGGPIIIKMATDFPQRYKALVILAGAVDPDEETSENWRRIIMANPIRYLIPGALRTSNDELWWLKSDLKALKPDLHKVISEVLIIHGTKDPLVPYSNSDYMIREFSNAHSVRRISIDNANHFIPWEHFGLIRDAIYDLY